MITDMLARSRAADLPRRLRLGTLIEAWIARDAHRRQMRQLARVEDHLLRDIGVTRDDVRRLTR